MAPLAALDLINRWSLYCMNLMGEAAMPVWVPTSSGVEERAGGGRMKAEPVTATIVRGVLLLPRDMTDFGSGKSDRVPRPALLDITGRKVMRLAPGPNDVSRLAPGVYFVRGAQPAHPGARKIVVR